MVKLNRIYTRTGDNGTTALVTGPRRLKADLRVEAYGTIDEANSAIGMARLYTETLAPVHEMLLLVQNDLFDLGSDLATPDTGEALSWEPLRITDSQVERVERDIDTLNARLLPLTSFVLPGGSPAAAHLHLARTITRRAERIMVDLMQVPMEKVSAPALKYVNRLSDFLFVAARIANEDGKADILWVPGQNR
ncbi:cob(I)yrinic acid a,c-diamide adenosyltransferase [Allorhizobium sp. BGMRC 0089]|uniref:cob(I)yrinic acid a,c-diamide adenosyltransferase n=1 Tax=Allorhizobium sonneratiae TaxID=2934936 RepID=UPI0020335BB9|nr:cob(I)yrinic acid a,c-diamide adenosyltransferase [Allorhizobium sonneratiae]MCM2293534.1 cob(I)yrinic acid a,c-diamide adenosyltransferase [Allorhizobium sonneratiae]